jgi:hypothetical protein
MQSVQYGRQELLVTDTAHEPETLRFEQLTAATGSISRSAVAVLGARCITGRELWDESK